MIGFRWTRSNQIALVVLALATAGIGALTWSPKALTQVGGGGPPIYLNPTALPQPVDQPDAPIRLSRFTPPAADRIPLPARIEEAEAIPIPKPSPASLTWKRDTSEKAPSCELECQYAHNDELRYCGGYVSAEQARADGRAPATPGCRIALYRTLQACMRRCGVDLPDPRPVPAPQAAN